MTVTRNGVTIRSDEVYEDVDAGATPDDLPPPYCPTAQPLNDLNRGTELRSARDQGASCSEVGCEREGSVECTCSAEEACCSLCSQSTSATALNNNVIQQEAAALSHSPVR